jgi:hypothetical protein
MPNRVTLAPSSWQEKLRLLKPHLEASLTQRWIRGSGTLIREREARLGAAYLDAASAARLDRR